MDYKNNDSNDKIRLELINKYLELEKDLILNNQLKEKKIIIGKTIQIIIVSTIIFLSCIVILINLKHKKVKH